MSAAAATLRYPSDTLLCASWPAPNESAERGCSEAVSEQGYTPCISVLGIVFGLQGKRTTPPLLWAINANQFLVVGIHREFMSFLVL